MALWGKVSGGSAELVQTNPSVTSRRLCEVLLGFPHAATGGVRWSILVRKFEERHGTSLDLSVFGKDATPLVGATALLWDILRLVDPNAPEGPVVAVEDEVALTPRPGAIGSWPSLYSTLCSLVRDHGTLMPQSSAKNANEAPLQGEPRRQGLLLSRLKPLLQANWHRNFEEHGLGFFDEQGTYVKLKKMKHLVQAVLRWRLERLTWRGNSGQKATQIDLALATSLVLLSPEGHNDLMLCVSEESCMVDQCCAAASIASGGSTKLPTDALLPASAASSESEKEEFSHEYRGRATFAVSQPSELEEENARLRAENELLRKQQAQQQQQQQQQQQMATQQQQQQMITPQRQLLPHVFTGISGCAVKQLLLEGPEMRLPEPGADELGEIFDNPFEPPPEAPSKHAEALWISLSTPSTSYVSSLQPSGCTTPASSAGAAPNGSCAEPSTPAGQGMSMPSFIPAVFGASNGMPTPQSFYDIVAIPQGIVDKFRGQFEQQTSVDRIPLPGPLWTQTAGLDRCGLR